MGQFFRRWILCSRSFRLIDWLIDDKLTLTWLVYWIRTARSVFTEAGLKSPNIAGQYSTSKKGFMYKKIQSHDIEQEKSTHNGQQNARWEVYKKETSLNRLVICPSKFKIFYTYEAKSLSWTGAFPWRVEGVKSRWRLFLLDSPFAHATCHCFTSGALLLYSFVFIRRERKNIYNSWPETKVTRDSKTNKKIRNKKYSQKSFFGKNKKTQQISVNDGVPRGNQWWWAPIRR